jgi:hypothetical protein
MKGACFPIHHSYFIIPFCLLEGEYQFRTLRLTDEVSLNIGPGEELVGVEILDAKEVLGHGALPTVVLENVPSVQAGA